MMPVTVTTKRMPVSKPKIITLITAITIGILRLATVFGVMRIACSALGRVNVSKKTALAKKLHQVTKTKYL